MSRTKTEGEKLFERNFGARVRSARVALGYSQDELGRLLGDSGNQSVSNYERGAQAPTLLRLADLARLLRVSVDDLVGAEPRSGPTAISGVAEEPAPFEGQRPDAPTRQEWLALYDTLTVVERQAGYAHLRRLPHPGVIADDPSGTA